MRLSQFQQPLRAAASSLLRPVPAATDAASRLRIEASNALVSGRRYASVKAQGAYKLQPKKTVMKKLGAKRTGDQFVLPGNILYKQRGSVWHPGENCIMGRDHTIHAMASGYVKYYRDPSLHPDRKYIGVVFNKSDTLPYPKHAERKRRLNLAAHPIVTRVPEPQVSASGIPMQVVRPASVGADGKTRGPARVLRLRDDYSYREDNWRIGRLVKLTGVTKFKGSRGHTHSRSARFRNKRWRKERQLLGERKAAQERGGDEAGEELDEWTLAAQRRKQEEKNKKAQAAQDEKRKKAEKQLKQRLAGMQRSKAKKG